MDHHKQAVAAAIVVALLAGVPVSAAAIRDFADDRAAEQARAERIEAAAPLVLASSNLVAAAVPAAAREAQVALESARTARPLVAHVLSVAREVADESIARRQLEITIRRGQTWQWVSDTYGISGTQLAELNPTVDMNRLDPGQRLVVYRYHSELPSSSRGSANRGRLVNGMPMPRGEHWVIRNPARSWGTAETISELIRGFTATAEALPGGGTPLVADISRRHGGRFRPHRSHVSGRDADVTYYRRSAPATPFFDRTTRSTLDHARQWYLFRYWIERDQVTYIFIDNRLQRSLYDFARAQGEDPELMEIAFGQPRGSGVLRYSPGHDDHFHVRFRCADHDAACRD